MCRSAASSCPKNSKSPIALRARRAAFGPLFRLSKNLYNEKGRPPYPYKSAKSRDLCVAFCTSQGRGAPLVRWPDGHTFFGPVAGRPYFLCFSAYNRPGAGAQYGSGGSPPAPCKNSKKWPKPLFRHAQKPLAASPQEAFSLPASKKHKKGPGEHSPGPFFTV